METWTASTRDRVRLARGRVHFVVIANGNASGYSPALQGAVADALRRASGRPVASVVTRTLDELAAAWPDDPAARVVLVGGDGSVHAAANLAGPPRAFALVPAGRANNVARSLGIPLELPAAVELAVRGRAQPLDCIEARTATACRRVVEGISVGFLASARERYRAANSADVGEALVAGASAIRHFHPLHATVRQGEAETPLLVAQLFVANLPLYAFGLHVAPHARPDDGLLDFVAIEARGRRSLPGIIARLRRNREIARPEVHCWRAPAGTIEPHGRSPVIADSESLGSDPVALRALPAALHVVAPPWRE